MHKPSKKGDLKYEIWKSDEGQGEVHLFDGRKQDEYIAGFNPKYFTEKKVKSLLDKAGFDSKLSDKVIAKIFKK
jgi:hypothetical protein